MAHQSVLTLATEFCYGYIMCIMWNFGNFVNTVDIIANVIVKFEISLKIYIEITRHLMQMYINEKLVDSWILVFNIQLALRIVSHIGLLINVVNNWLFQY